MELHPCRPPRSLVRAVLAGIQLTVHVALRAVNHPRKQRKSNGEVVFPRICILNLCFVNQARTLRSNDNHCHIDILSRTLFMRKPLLSKRKLDCRPLVVNLIQRMSTPPRSNSSQFCRISLPTGKTVLSTELSCLYLCIKVQKLCSSNVIYSVVSSILCILHFTQFSSPNLYWSPLNRCFPSLLQHDGHALRQVKPHNTWVTCTEVTRSTRQPC